MKIFNMGVAIVGLFLLPCLAGYLNAYAIKDEAKTIIIGVGAKVVTLHYILNNWNRIESGILEAGSRKKCVEKEASIESIKAINEIFGDIRSLVVDNEKLLSKNSRVFAVSTKSFCEPQSKYTTGPTWYVINKDNEFKVVGPSYIEE